MYWILRKENSDEETGGAILEGELFGTYESLSLEKGKFYKPPPPPKWFFIPRWRLGPLSLRFKTDDDSQPGIMTDLLTIYEISGLVLSERFRTFLEEQGVTNIQYFDLTIEEIQTEKTYTNYKVANLLDLVPCIDKEQSELIYDEEEIDEVDKLVLDEACIPADKKLFRVEELPLLVLVKDSLKQAIEEAGITGCVFMHPDDYIL